MAHEQRIVGIAIAKPGIRKKNPAKLKWLVAILAVATIIATAVKFWPANLLDQATPGGAPQMAQSQGVVAPCDGQVRTYVAANMPVHMPNIGNMMCASDWDVTRGAVRVKYITGDEEVVEAWGRRKHPLIISFFEAMGPDAVLALRAKAP